jgi:ubiquinone/menaquinone biosynthesis C-methylase UbiE
LPKFSKMNTISLRRKSDRMTDTGFKMMSWVFKVTDLFRDAGKRIETFRIKPGFVVVDWGCGPGRHIRKASGLAGATGTVYAVDVHELAIRSVDRIIDKFNLQNVVPVLTDGGSVEIDDDSADLVYALDMFHMVNDPNEFLRELNRITKKNGVLFIEDGHQSRARAKQKILLSGDWTIIEEKKQYLKCKPIKVALKVDTINLLS